MNRRITACEIDERNRELTPAVRCKIERYRRSRDKIMGTVMGRALATLRKRKLLP